MNPTTQLISAALLFGFTGLATAQSSVTLYGLVDIGIVRESGGVNKASVTKLTGGVSAGSRLGFRGVEDLGGGLSALFVLEMGIQADTGALGQGGLSFGRQSFVGISGGFGTLTLGRQYTPVANLQADTDPFSVGLAGDAANMISPGGQGGSNRMDNTIRYQYVDANGLQGEVAYAFGESAVSSKVLRQYGFSAGYVKGPVYFKVGHENTNSASQVAGKVTYVGAKYDFEVAVLHLNYVVNKGSQVFGIVNADSRDILVGVTVPFGAHRFMASYIDKNDKTNQNFDANQFAVGYMYMLSKRTSLYASTARIRNSVAAGSPSGFYRVGNSSDSGTGSRAFNFGIRHRF